MVRASLVQSSKESRNPEGAISAFLRTNRLFFRLPQPVLSLKAAHVVHFSGQIRGFFCISAPQKKNKNCRVFGRMFKMFANISPSCWNAFPHGALVSNSQNAPPLLCNGSNKRVAHSTLPTNDRTKDLILVARCLIFENW